MHFQFALIKKNFFPGIQWKRACWELCRQFRLESTSFSGHTWKERTAPNCKRVE